MRLRDVLPVVVEGTLVAVERYVTVAERKHATLVDTVIIFYKDVVLAQNLESHRALTLDIGAVGLARPLACAEVIAPEVVEQLVGAVSKFIFCAVAPRAYVKPFARGAALGVIEVESGGVGPCRKFRVVVAGDRL